MIDRVALVAMPQQRVADTAARLRREHGQRFVSATHRRNSRYANNKSLQLTVAAGQRQFAMARPATELNPASAHRPAGVVEDTMTLIGAYVLPLRCGYRQGDQERFRC
jgi:hypothetical protein